MFVKYNSESVTETCKQSVSQSAEHHISDLSCTSSGSATQRYTGSVIEHYVHLIGHLGLCSAGPTILRCTLQSVSVCKKAPVKALNDHFEPDSSFNYAYIFLHCVQMAHCTLTIKYTQQLSDEISCPVRTAAPATVPALSVSPRNPASGESDGPLPKRQKGAGPKQAARAPNQPEPQNGNHQYTDPTAKIDSAA